MSSPGARDIFVSYAREDEALVAVVVAYFERQGWTVFWDKNLRGGDVWPKQLEDQLATTPCVLVLWSKHSVGSNWVREEARFGASRQVLVTARIDEASAPLGFGQIQVGDLSGWSSEGPPAGIAPITTRIRQLIEESRRLTGRSGLDDKLILAQKLTRTEHISVSDHDRDKQSVLDQLGDAMPSIHDFIRNGYRELQAAQYAARYVVNDRAPETHYASAADHFRNALDALGDKKNRPARDERPVEYFLSMERANSLAFSEPVRGVAHAAALEIYERLAEDPRYRNDVPVHFRLGCALARSAQDEVTIHKAIRELDKARALAQEADREAGITDPLLSEGAWIYFEIAKQMGLCYFHQSQIYGDNSMRGRAALEDSILHTRNAVVHKRPANDYDELMGFTVVKALGNLIYLLATKLRNGTEEPGIVEEISNLIAALKAPDHWAVVRNQISIIDSIAFGAASIGDWATAAEEAKRNLEYISTLALPGGLAEEDKAIQARAREIHYFSELFLKGKAALC